MIKFFRKIRQRLLTENKFSKYLLYAIGEIILVVIGILIALSINNWNEEKKLKLKSKEYSENLISDITTDVKNLDKLIKNCKAMQKNIDTYFDNFDRVEYSLSEHIDNSKIVQWDFFRYLPVNYTFADMQSSGNTTLLNEEQKGSLSELLNSQKFLQIIIEKTIDDIKHEIYERNKYIDYDRSKGGFFKIVGVSHDKNIKAQGLLHQHNVLTNVHDLCYNLIKFGELIKKQSENSSQLLAE